MYRNWISSREHPTIESQVINDLQKELSVSKEVLNRLAGNEENGKVSEILNGYREYVETEHIKSLAASLSRQIADSMAEPLSGVLEKWLRANTMPRAVRMVNPIQAIGKAVSKAFNGIPIGPKGK